MAAGRRSTVTMREDVGDPRKQGPQSLKAGQKVFLGHSFEIFLSIKKQTSTLPPKNLKKKKQTQNKNQFRRLGQCVVVVLFPTIPELSGRRQKLAATATPQDYQKLTHGRRSRLS